MINWILIIKIKNNLFNIINRKYIGFNNILNKIKLAFLNYK